jgi:hypothetical protein
MFSFLGPVPNSIKNPRMCTTVMLSVLYGCETLSPSLRGEHKTGHCREYVDLRGRKYDQVKEDESGEANTTHRTE